MGHSRFFRLSAMSAAVASALVTGQQAQAQQQTALEEVIVTATRRSESIQDIPLNIAAVSGEAIESQGLSSLAEVMQWVPGVHIVDQGSRAADTIVVRGLNAAPIAASEALNNSGGDTVSTYVGEIPLYIDLKLNDIERVEVLLGPQGTLYGAGTLGGAIRYLPNRPDFDATEIEVRGDMYQIDEADDLSYSAGTTINVPFGDTLALRVNLDYLDDSGFIDYVYTVREAGVSNPDPDFNNPDDVRANLRAVDDVNTEETLSARVALRWAPSDFLDGTLTYYLQEQDSGGRNINNRDALGIGKYESGLRFVEPSERTNELLALELTADLGFAELTSATGYSTYEEDGSRDQTDLLITLEYSYEAFPSFSAFTQENVDENRFNQEFRLVSNSDGAFNWIAGAFYNQLETDSADSKEFTPNFDKFAVAEFDGIQERPDSLEYFSVDIQDTTEWAFYGELSYRITERWDVTVGARYYDYEFEGKSAVDFPLLRTVFFGEDPDSIVLDFESNKQEDDGTLFKFNTSYDLSEDAMVYFTYSEGYRIGASNGIGPCPDFIPPDVQLACALPGEEAYDPDETQNYEIGWRTAWMDNALVFNGAVYFIDWKDPQLASTTENAALPITVNGKGARSQGLEMSFNWLLGDHWSLRGSYAYTDAELTEDAPDLLSTVEGPGFGIVRVDGEDGDRLPASPEHQGNLYANFYTALGGLDLDVSYGITAISDVLTKTGGRANGEALPGYAVHNLSASLRDDAWSVTFYADNLLDKYAVTGVRADTAYLQTVSDINGDPVTTRRYFNNVLRPRTIGLRATYRFDL